MNFFFQGLSDALNSALNVFSPSLSGLYQGAQSLYNSASQAQPQQQTTAPTVVTPPAIAPTAVPPVQQPYSAPPPVNYNMAQGSPTQQINPYANQTANGAGTLSTDASGNVIPFNSGSRGTPSVQPMPQYPTTSDVTSPVTASSTATTDSKVLNSGVTGSDINSIISQNLSKQDGFLQNIANYLTPSSDEIAQQQGVINANNDVNQYGLDTLSGEKALAGTGRGEPAALVGAQQTQLQNQRAVGLMAKQNQASLLAQLLTNTQTNRQTRLQAAQYLFNATSQQLNQAVDLYAKTAPEAIGSPIVDASGNATLPMRNPLTGKITLTPIGNVGPVAKQVEVSKIGQHFDMNVGQMVDDYGILNKSTGTITPLSGSQYAGQQFGVMPDNSTVPFQSSGTMRTDRNNNPIAASLSLTSNGTINQTDTFNKQWIDALQQAQIPFSVEQGADFDNRATIQFPNPQAGLAGAEALLSTSAFQWYKSHTGTQALNGINSAKEFAALPESQKAAIVDGIYRNEGGQHQSWVQLAQSSPALQTSAQDMQSANLGSSSFSSVGGRYQQIVNQLPVILRNAVKQLPDGTPYIDKGTISGEGTGIQVMAGTWASKLGIQALSSDDANLVQDVSRAIQNLNVTTNQFAQIAEPSAIGALGRNITDPFSKFFGTIRGSNVKAFQSNRDSLFQQINALAGSHPRINQQEIQLAANALPTWSELNHDTLQDGLTKVANTYQYLDSAIKSVIPGYVGTPIHVGGEFAAKAPDGRIYTFPSLTAAQQFMTTVKQ